MRRAASDYLARPAATAERTSRTIISREQLRDIPQEIEDSRSVVQNSAHVAPAAMWAPHITQIEQYHDRSAMVVPVAYHGSD